MVYRSILNAATFVSPAASLDGSSDATVRLATEDYEFIKTADPVEWSGEDPLTYTITLTAAAGADDLTDVTVTDVLPANVTFIPGSVEINGVPSTNFNDTGLPTVIFGTTTPLTVTSDTPLVIIFQVENATP